MMKTILKFLNDAETFYLATTEDNKPDVRPMGIAVNYEDRIYFITMKEMNLHSQLQKDSKISISADFNGNWVRLYGNAILDDSIETKEGLAGLGEQISKTFPIDTMAPYYLKDVNASIDSFTEESKVYTF